MKKKFEKKVVVPSSETDGDYDLVKETEVRGVKCLYQVNIPYDDWFGIYQACTDEYLKGELVEPNDILSKILLDNYSNISTEGLSGGDMYFICDDLCFSSDLWGTVIQKLNLFIIGQEVYNSTTKALKEFFNEDVSKDLVEQLKEDISSFDTDKLKELTSLFIETNIK